MARSNSKPVWLNDRTKLYVVVLDDDGDKEPCFVLSDKGPLKAGHMAFEVTGKAVKKCQEWPFPLLVPDISEVADLVDSSSPVAQLSQMTLYRFLMGNTTCLVWTKQPEANARVFAELSMGHKSTWTYVVTNPVIVDTSVERMLADA